MTQNPACNEEAPSPSQSSQLQAQHSQRFSALAAKYTLQDDIEWDDDCFADNEGDESDICTSHNDSDSGDSDDELYT